MYLKVNNKINVRSRKTIPNVRKSLKRSLFDERKRNEILRERLCQNQKYIRNLSDRIRQYRITMLWIDVKESELRDAIKKELIRNDPR